ncbi:MAG: vitamin K epoxide reductase family protein [Vicinamibacterales bacterium]
MSRNATRLALAFALLGLVSSAAAAYIHFRLLADPSYQSVCDVSATVNCTAVYSSRFGSFAGISVALFGTIWFAFATLLAAGAVSAEESTRRNIAEYLFAGSTVSLAAVLYLGYASFVVLNRVCVLCVLTYVAVGGLFLVSGASSSMSLLSVPGQALRDLRLLASRPKSLALAVGFVLASALALAFFPRHSPSESLMAGTPGAAPVGFEEWYAGLPRVTLDVDREGADVLIVKFNDYQCPPCRQTHMAYQSVLAKYEASHPGKVRYVLRDFPLESECNAIVSSDLHPASCEAAVAVRLAREQGKASEMENWLFANQPSMTPEMVAQGASDVGGVSDFPARYESTLPAVRADIQQGIDIGARSTPTFVINGVMLAGGVPPQVFDLIIAHELERAGSASAEASPSQPQ